MRIGTGFDIHRHDNVNKLSIGTVNTEGPGFVAHSDGDVVAHALVDALLAAAGLGDIGEVFPSKDKKLKDASGKILLSITKDLISLKVEFQSQKGGSILMIFRLVDLKQLYCER